MNTNSATASYYKGPTGGGKGPDWDKMFRIVLYFMVTFFSANGFLYLWNGTLPI